MHVGIIGGTGPAGQALAARLAASGVRVTLGSRSSERGVETVSRLRAKWPDHQLEIEGGSNEEAAAAPLVVIATPWDSAASTASELADAIAGKVVVSMANALARVGSEFQALVPARGSIAASVQAAVPRSKVSGAFHHLPARSLAAIDKPIEADVLVAADDAEALEATVALVDAMAGLRGVRSGSLASCGAIEALTAVLLNVNVAHRAHASIRLTGLDHAGPAER
jgi:NADPH-dependent F420 reductase